MIDLKEVHEMWQKDCIIDNYQLDETSRQTPALHSKYIQLWSTAKLELKRAEFDQKKLLKEKWLYYNGKMDQQTLEEKGWNPDPFNGLKILKGENMKWYYVYENRPTIYTVKAESPDLAESLVFRGFGELYGEDDDSTYDVYEIDDEEVIKDLEEE